MSAQKFHASLGALLECPICYEVPKPGTKSMAMCSAGHVVCRQCFKTMQKTEVSLTCPRCRDKTFTLQPNNYLIYNLSEMLVLGRIIKCPYAPACTFEGLGNVVGPHQQTCPHMPMYCINWHCDQKLGFFEMVASHQNCYKSLQTTKVEVLDDNQKRLTWSTHFSFTDIFDMHKNCLWVQESFKPILLQHPTNQDFRAYFVPILATEEKIQMSMAWLSDTCNAPATIQTLRPHMTVLFPTRLGEFGTSSRETFWFNEDMASFNYPFSASQQNLICMQVKHPKTILFEKQQLLHWLKLAHREKCPSCDASTASRGPHIHINIEITETNHLC